MQIKHLVLSMLATLFVGSVPLLGEDVVTENRHKEISNGKRVGDRYELDNVGSIEDFQKTREWREIVIKELKEKNFRLFCTSDKALSTGIAFSTMPSLDTTQKSLDVIIENTVQTFIKPSAEGAVQNLHVVKYRRSANGHDWSCVNIEHADPNGTKMFTEFMIRFEDVVYQFQMSALTKEHLAELILVAESFEPNRETRSAPIE